MVHTCRSYPRGLLHRAKVDRFCQPPSSLFGKSHIRIPSHALTILIITSSTKEPLRSQCLHSRNSSLLSASSASITQGTLSFGSQGSANAIEKGALKLRLGSVFKMARIRLLRMTGHCCRSWLCLMEHIRMSNFPFISPLESN